MRRKSASVTARNLNWPIGSITYPLSEYAVGMVLGRVLLFWSISPLTSTCCKSYILCKSYNGHIDMVGRRSAFQRVQKTQKRKLILFTHYSPTDSTLTPGKFSPRWSYQNSSVGIPQTLLLRKHPHICFSFPFRLWCRTLPKWIFLQHRPHSSVQFHMCSFHIWWGKWNKRLAYPIGSLRDPNLTFVKAQS